MGQDWTERLLALGHFLLRYARYLPGGQPDPERSIHEFFDVYIVDGEPEAELLERANEVLGLMEEARITAPLTKEGFQVASDPEEVIYKGYTVVSELVRVADETLTKAGVVGGGVVLFLRPEERTHENTRFRILQPVEPAQVLLTAQVNGRDVVGEEHGARQGQHDVAVGGGHGSRAGGRPDPYRPIEDSPLEPAWGDFSGWGSRGLGPLRVSPGSAARLSWRRWSARAAPRPRVPGRPP